MNRQAIVIGLGQFGLSIARALADRGVEVLAVDRQEDRVRAAATFAVEAACFDATDTDALTRTSPDRREVSVCAIGDESRESSIICTALLRQMGAKRIIARANDALHARILRLVGAHQIVNPEQEFGERFASQILHESIKGELRLGQDLLITEFQTPPAFVGHSLADLQLPRRFGITVVAIRRTRQSTVVLPGPAQTLSDGDVLVVVSKEGAVAKLIERN